MDVEALEHFDAIRLEDMDRVQLMNRVDTKFAIPTRHIPALLTELTDDYLILEVKGKRLLSYQSLYFDDPGKTCYLDHHNGRTNRIKVRIRKYVESDTHFVEVKHKFKGRTDKKRQGISHFDQQIPTQVARFVSLERIDLTTFTPSLWNTFQRITLVHKEKNERLTLDFSVTFENIRRDRQENLSHIVIAELKQEKLDRSTRFFTLMKQRNITPYRLSKYCIGICLLHPTEIKTNRFKTRLLKLQKLKTHVA